MKNRLQCEFSIKSQTKTRFYECYKPENAWVQTVVKKILSIPLLKNDILFGRQKLKATVAFSG